MLEQELPTCSVFENLEFLQIGDWCLIDSLCIILSFLQLSPRLQKLILTHRKVPQTGKGARRDSIPSNELTFQCPHLQTVIIQCSKDDSEIGTLVKTMVDNGVSLEKIQVTYYEDIVKRCLSEVTGTSQQRKKEFGILEKTLKENSEWEDDSFYGGSESDSDDDESLDEDDDDDSELGDDDEDDSGGEAEAENGWEDEAKDDDEIEDEHDHSKIEDEDNDDDIEDAGLGNNEHGDDDL